MNIPFRTRRRLRRLGIAFLVLFLVFVIAWLCWVIWLERYVIYTREGAHIDFDLSQDLVQGIVALPPSGEDEVSIYFNEGDNSIETTNELTQLKGYYIDTKALGGDISALIDAVDSLPKGTPIMLDLKSISGNFFYPSELADALYAGVDMAQMNQLIDKITGGDYYAIARIPAFRDYNYGLNHVSCGLPLPQGYLWMDDYGCYWLNPANSETLNWIISIVEEVKKLGFHEVVLTDFRFPDTDRIVFDGDRTEALTKAMNTLLSNCGSATFTLSFGTTSPSFTLAEGRCRLYLEGIEAKNVGLTASQVTVQNPQVYLVFVATANDTRYDAYSVLRPIDSAKVLEQAE